jgi:hypothetical protein
MKGQRLKNGDYSVQMRPSEFHIMQFLAMFFLNVPRVVFRGRMVRRVKRIHESLKEIS